MIETVKVGGPQCPGVDVLARERDGFGRAGTGVQLKTSTTRCVQFLSDWRDGYKNVVVIELKYTKFTINIDDPVWFLYPEFRWYILTGQEITEQRSLGLI
eukprot:2321273-Lingulodinium_polyedra.AAC.1